MSEKICYKYKQVNIPVKAHELAQEIAKQKGERLADTWITALQDYSKKDSNEGGGWISTHRRLPDSHVYVALMNKHSDNPPTVGWATYWQPNDEFAGFEVQADYESDYGKEFTRWMEL